MLRNLHQPGGTESQVKQDRAPRPRTSGACNWREKQVVGQGGDAIRPKGQLTSGWAGNNGRARPKGSRPRKKIGHRAGEP